MKKKLVVFGFSNILSDIVDCAYSQNLIVTAIVEHLPENCGERDKSIRQRLKDFAKIQEPPAIIQLQQFVPAADELYILGPTTPTREELASELTSRFDLEFHTLVHQTAYVSPLATIGQGVFIGARSVIGPGTVVHDHVFINRGVTVGHDNEIASFSRLQPGSNIGGLGKIGKGVTIGIGATVLERIIIGDNAVVGGGAVVTEDVAQHSLVVGVPAKFKKSYAI